MTEVNLRKLLMDRLNIDDISILWFDLFKTQMRADMPTQPLSECVIGLIARAKQRQISNHLVLRLNDLFPHVLNPNTDSSVSGQSSPSASSQEINKKKNITTQKIPNAKLLDELRALLAAKTDVTEGGPLTEKATNWFSRGYTLLRYVNSEWADEFDHYAHMCKLPLSGDTLNPIWSRVLQILQNAVYELELTESASSTEDITPKGKNSKMRRSNMFDDMARDVVVLMKSDGQRFEDIKADVQSKMIFIGDSTLPIEEGDIILRSLPNNLTERYIILDSGFQRGAHGIPDHYQTKVRKETSITDTQARSVQNVYNLHGANSRVNINSEDNSVNSISTVDTSIFADMRKALQVNIVDDVVRAPIMGKVDEMEKAVGTKIFVERYREFMAVAADHIGVISPFLPSLAQLL